MRVIALVSGGKDSCYNMVQCVAAGHEIVGLAHLRPPPADYEEMDSHMFQTVGSSGVDYIAKAMRLPLFIQEITGTGKEIGGDYTPTEGDEVEDLYSLLDRACTATDAKGVSVGAILSDYQRVRVESVCIRLGLTSLAYLWQRDQAELLEEMVNAGMKCVLVKVACLGLKHKHLSRTLGEMKAELMDLNSKYGVNVCGEGGEYETYTLDSPLFYKELRLVETEVVHHTTDPIAPVAYLKLKTVELVDKPQVQDSMSQSELLQLGLLGDISPLDFVSDVATDVANLKVIESSSSQDMEVIDFSQLEENAFCTTKPNHPEKSWTEFTNIPGRGETLPDAVNDAFRHLKDLVNQGVHHADTGSLENLGMLARVILYIPSMADYAEINKHYVLNFGINPPVRVCVALGRDKFPSGVSLMLVARLPPLDQPRKCLHVQGVSHWAPANIGPYSQGVLGGESLLLHVAGQIGLVPGSMSLIEGGVKPEAVLALRHTERVIAAVYKLQNVSADNIEIQEAVCYMTAKENRADVECVWTQWMLRKKFSAIQLKFKMAAELPRGALVEWELVTRKIQ